MDGKLFVFEVELEGDILSGESFPLYDEDKKMLLGGFTLIRGNLIRGFVSGANHPVALRISEDDLFYVTPKQDETGKVSHAVISECSISVLSTAAKAVLSTTSDNT